MADDFEGGDDLGDTEEYIIDGENFDSDALRPGQAGTVDQAGWYHFEVTDVKPEISDRSKAPCVRFDLTVLHSVPGQSPEGSKLFHRVFLASKEGGPAGEGSQRAGLKFGRALGLFEVVKLDDGREVTVIKGTKTTRIGHKIWEFAKGRQLVAKVKFTKSDNPKYQDKYEIPWSDDCYDPSDPAVADIPKNEEYLAAIGKASAPPAEKQPEKPVSKPPAAEASGAAPFDPNDLSDL